MVHRVVYTRPYDARVEYLASPASASTYIDTGLKQSDIVSIETQFADILGYGGSYRYSIGSGTGSNDSNIIGFKVYNGNLTVNLKGSTTTVSSGHLNTFKTVSVNFVTGAVKINSAERELTPCELTDDIFYLFKIPTVSGQRYGFQPIMLKYFKAFSANNTLIRDMIPVRVGQIGYMYDRVSRKLFGNKGTDNFSLGSDVANPIPNIRRVFRFGNKRFVMPMPYDSKIEYLGTDGNQYIDTGIRTCDIGKISSMMRYDSKPSGNIGDGSVISGSFYGLVGMVGKSNTYYYGAQFAGAGKEVASSTKYNDGKFHTLLLDILNRAFTLDNDTPISLEVASTSPELNWYIFKRNTVPRTAVSKRKIIKIWNKSNILVRDFIPVRRGNVGYLYDKVSGKLFSNAGTGQFILGNDIN